MDDGLVLFPKPLFDRMLHNGTPERRDRDHAPVVKIFSPMGRGTWLLSEAEPFAFDESKEPDDYSLFGLCDLGEPELGPVLRSEMESVRMPVPFQMVGLERDTSFRHDHALPMSAYSAWARLEGTIDLNVDLETLYPWAWAKRGMTSFLPSRHFAVLGRFIVRVNDIITDAGKSQFRVLEVQTKEHGAIGLRFDLTANDKINDQIARLADEAEQGVAGSDE